MGKVAHAWRWWFMGQLVDMLVVGVLTTIGLMLVGMPLALALGVLAGLLTFVPYFGAILAAIPALAIALGSGWHMVLMTLLVFGVCHLGRGLCRLAPGAGPNGEAAARFADPVDDLHGHGVRPDGHHHGEPPGRRRPGAGVGALRGGCARGRERPGRHDGNNAPQHRQSERKHPEC
jgi:hypothetical protein